MNAATLITDKTIQYLTIPAVVGHESVFIAALARDFEKLGLRAEAHEGLLAVHGTKPHSAIICAHIDRHGLISIGGGNYVYAARHIREIKYGEICLQSQSELNSIVSRFVGEAVYAYDTQSGLRLGDGTIEPADCEILEGENIFHIKGMEAMPPETPVAYARKARLEDGMLKGQIDNALSLGLVYALFEAGFQGTALLSCEEEIGKSWVPLSAYLDAAKQESQSLIVLDTSPYADLIPIQTGRVILRGRDMSAVFNPALVAALKTRCGALNIPFSLKDEDLLAAGKTVDQLGSTELGKLMKFKACRWSGATVQVPTMMYHTSNESASLASISNAFTVLKDILIEHPLSIMDSEAA